MTAAESDRLPDKVLHLAVIFLSAPLYPGDFVVLAVGIIIASLGISHLISAIDSRNSLGQQQDQERIAHLTSSERLQRFFGRRSLFTVIAAVIAVCPVPVVFPVVFIVLHIVRNRVRQGKSIVAGYVIDHRLLRRISSHTLGDLPQCILISFQEAARFDHKIIVILRQPPECRLII